MISKKNRYQNNRQNNFQNNSRHKDRSRKQKTYTNNYEHESFYDFESYEKIDPNEKYNENDSNIQYLYNLTSEFSEVCRKCEISKKNFISNNSFHAHIRVCKNQSVKVTTSSFVKISNFSIIEFSTSITVDNEFEFRSYRYVTIWIIVALQTPVEAVTDNECVVFLIDEAYLRQILSAKKFIKMTVFINVREIKNAFRESDFYLLLNLYLNEIFRDLSAREYFRKEIHIVNDLKCKIFLNMNILKAKQMTFNMKDKTMILFTCKDLIVFIRIAPKSNARIRRVIHFKNQTVISVKAVAQMLIYFKKKRFSDDRNYFFESDQKQLAIALSEMNDFYAHVCEGNLICVQIKNDRNVAVKISQKVRFGTLTEYEEEECYQLNEIYHDVAIVISVKQMKIWFENSNNYEAFHDTENSKFIFENFFFQNF